ncbi:TGF-beta-activated kinase 1 and MAP3K7-binding protein 3 isoform X6 [Ooceraea biroi]|uniref:TGF-beta-activated kinase 1 and MAP3K7-binding protein 3 isoform X6 n=1 Tax=Ooceraea biroi TaxID=2015173 RepID=UPI0009716A9F|nr:TGF-beta-activated kinase 1 and MAP3K7-binding protein 3 isoform X6 [Ooceraea biroi]
MGECHCSNITIMQLFHELKQQFPALPDHVVSQCIAQNSHDRETCARSLRATQESRPSPGAFPPPGPCNVGLQHPAQQQQQGDQIRASLQRCCAMSQVQLQHQQHGGGRPHRPASLDIDFRTVPTIGACKRSDLIVVPRPHYAEPLLATGKSGAQIDHTRSYTSVSLTLRPPSSEPQPPIDIRSEGSSLTYSTSSLDPRGFQSRLQISIGPGNVGSVAAARIRPPMVPNRPNSLLPPTQTSPQRPPGLPPGPPSQLPRPTTTMSAPNTPSVPSTTNIVPTCSLPTTPSGPATSSSGVAPPSGSVGEYTQTASDQNRSPSSQVAEHQRKLVAEQLARKERLAKELRAEKGRLEAMKKEIQALARPIDPSVSPQELKVKLRSEIYQLQVECDRLADEVDQWSDRRVPLGETNEEFYQGIYTGQPLPMRPLNPPPLPSQPPAWRPQQMTTAADNDREERGEPSWVCTMCTFDNHPLMSKCEECDMPRLLNPGGGSAGTAVHQQRSNSSGVVPPISSPSSLLSSSSATRFDSVPPPPPLQPPGIE